MPDGIEQKHLDEVKKSLEKISDQVKEQGEKVLAEAKKGVQLGEEQRSRLDDALTKQGELREEVKGLAARVEEAEQKAARSGKEGDAEARKSLGERFVESDNVKQFMKDRPGKGNARMSCKAVTNVTSATSGTGAGGALVQVDRVQSPMMTPGQRRLTIRDLIAKGRTGGNSIEYVQESAYQNMAAVVAEAAAKPQSDMAFALVTSAVVTLAHWLRASKQILDDAAMLGSYVDTRLTYGLKYVEELQLLMGSGSGGNLNGIYTQATAYSAPAGGYGGGFYQDGSTAVAAQALDTIRLALLQVELAYYAADGIVLNPTQWSAIETLKDASGRYMIGDPKSDAMPKLWGRDLVPTQAMTTDKFLVGNFGMGAQVFDREDANVAISTEDGSNFTSNLVTIRAEERLALAVYRTDAFVKGDLGFVA